MSGETRHCTRVWDRAEPAPDFPTSPRKAHRITSTWWRHGAVLAHLDVDAKTLRARMRESPDHLDPPWINVGSDRRPDYRWVAERVDGWWIEVNRWRQQRVKKKRTVRRPRAEQPAPTGSEGGKGGLLGFVRSLDPA